MLSRLVGWTVLVVGGFALLAQTTRAQDLAFPSRSSGDYAAAVNALNDLKTARGIPAGQLETARKHFASFAKYYADVVKHPLLYKGAQDPSVRDSKGLPIPSLDGVGGIIPELQRFLMEPVPPLTAFSFPTVDRADYIREMGTALDNAFKPIIEENPDRVVRINATRMLAAACRTGATAHYPTVTALLKNANTPVEIRNYALVAAGNLLSAYDVFDVKSRRHSNGWKQMPKGAAEKELAELVVEIEKFILNPGTAIGIEDIKSAKLTREQVDVIRFIRKQAIRALAQVRFAAIPGVDGASTIYPAHTLARVCVSDPALLIEPTPAECAEAAIGICNMAPIRDGRLRKDYNADMAVEAVTAALVTFASPRAQDPFNKALPWRGYGLRLADALNNWRPLFDELFDPKRPTVYAANVVPQPVSTLIQRSQTALFVPLEKVGADGKPDLVGGRIEIEDLKQFLKQQRDRKDRKPLFTGTPTEIYNPPAK